MHDLLYSSRGLENSPLWRLDVRVKLAVSLAAVLAVILSTRLALPLAACVACVSAAVALGAPLRATLWRMIVPLSLAAVVAVLRTFLVEGEPLWSLRLGAWQLVASREGLQAGLLIASRVLGSVSVILLLCTFTPAYRIFSALQWARVPRNFVEIAMMMYRYIFTFFEQAQSVRWAQRIRLGYRGTARTLRSAGSLAGIVALRSIDQADKTHEAMTARGYRGTLQLPPLGRLSRRDALATLAAVAAVAALLLIAQRSPL